MMDSLISTDMIFALVTNVGLAKAMATHMTTKTSQMEFVLTNFFTLSAFIIPHPFLCCLRHGKAP